MNFIKNNKALVAIAAVIIVVVTVIASGFSYESIVRILLFAVALTIIRFSYVNSVRNEGIRIESELNATYKDSMAELSSYTQKVQESLGVAELGTGRVQEILVEAVKGRYDGKMEPGTEGSMFSAIQEAYPDLTATSETYSKIQTLVEVGRDSFKNRQMIMSSRIANYETWKKTGLLRSTVVNMLGFPSDDLKVTIGDATYKGEDALDKMNEVIMSTEALGDFESGVSDPLIQRDEDK